jgi:hypothetical protein
MVSPFFVDVNVALLVICGVLYLHIHIYFLTLYHITNIINVIVL